jgi:hypothetical protein
MKPTNAKCTMCGATLTLVDVQEIVICDYCHTSNILQNSIDLANSDPNDSMEIKALRENLSQFVQRDEIEDIVRVSSQIKNIIPNDFKANYYFAYGKQIYGQESPLYFFLKEPPLFTNEELTEVIDHISKRGNTHDKPAFASFIKQHDPLRLEDYLLSHEKRVIKEQEYLNYPRDVFVAFSKYDYSDAKAIVEQLEESGFSCWISKRNLRPGLPEKGRSQIEDAISNCDTFLWLSSEHSMINTDLADQLDYALEEQRHIIIGALDNTNPNRLVLSAIKDGADTIKSPTSSGIIQLIKQQKVRTSKESQPPVNFIESNVQAQEWTEVDLKNATQEFLSLFQYVVLNQRTNNDVIEFLYYMTGIRKVTELSPRKQKVFADLYESLSDVYRNNFDHSEYMLNRFIRYTNKRYASQKNKLTVHQLKQLIDSMSRRFK